MKLSQIFAVLVFSNIFMHGYCTVFAMTGYFASDPNVRNLLIKSGLSSVVSKKAVKLYEASNFRHVSDQGTDIRKAQMGSHDIIEIDRNLQTTSRNDQLKLYKRRGIEFDKVTEDSDRVYSERLFSVVGEMDKNGCISRLFCEIGADPKSFGIIGLKINHYIKSVPPVTWNSATFPYLESFHAGLSSSKDVCKQHYSTCMYDLKRVMKFFWIFVNPINFKLSGL